MKTPRYYEALGRGTDFILRCKDCKTLVLVDTIAQLGCCPGTPEKACGNKRFAEIALINDVERAAIARMDFPHKEAFLAEFSAVSA